MAGAGESPTKVLSPGGRPIHYRGSEGWASRIISKSLAAGAVYLQILMFRICYSLRGWSMLEDF